ncbi:SDR family NAD(P)-dependent oxidoreductase [uncultured Ilumatobacter sp.]|uniref:SDR family NAD(P)-dependent oxidoreductase n=1 Tax=uncultured Ilumatobacter sp. TaxID=879968 RepID=UPI00374F8950
MDLRLRDSAVIVTGGGSNIGRAIVHGFAAEGARILIADRDIDQATVVVEEAKELGAAEVIVLGVDLTTEGAGAAIVEAAIERLGGVDALVNNVGWSVPDFFSKTDSTEWQKSFDLNLMTAFSCTHAVLPAMQQGGHGSIVYISSDAAFGTVRTATYGAAKAGLIAFAKTIAKEHGRDGIRTNVVCPGVVLPDDDAVGAGSLWRAGRDAIFNDAQLASVERELPLRRLTTAADVANSVLFFSSDAASRQLTGQVVSVSGGYSMP